MESHMEKESPSYYAIIPANVRYDKRLKANAKLLYGEITALTHKEGYCWATNTYFADLYGVGRNTVSLWIQSLSDCGYISIEYEYAKNSLQIVCRKLSIVKNGTPITKNNEDNITSQNNTRSNTREYCAYAQTPEISGEPSQNDLSPAPALIDPPKAKRAKPDKPKEQPLIQREPKNDQERVIRPYLLNFKTLYEQGQVATPEPILNHGQIGKLIKDHLARRITVEQLVSAVNRAMNDDFVLASGYTLSVILGAGSLNRLLNSKATIPKWTATRSRHNESFERESFD
jgi:hypothetical protein